MKVVLDTNVLVAGLLSPFGPPGEIVRMAASDALTLCFDSRILTEYEDVLSRPKFPFKPESVHALLDQIRADGYLVAGEPLASPLPDPTDQPFPEVALTGRAHCLITGNVKHFPSGKCQGMKVLSPTEFLDYYRRKRKSKP
ncbi:MAG: putative toxin-antitoxin system toxin component, PIN family [Nitrospirota bacterium]